MPKRELLPRCLVAIGALAAGLAPAPASAATLFGRVYQGAAVISDPSGAAEIAPGASAAVSIFLGLGSGELASSFDGTFDLVASGLPSSSDLSPVEAEWSSVAEHTSGIQSSWAEISPNLGGERLVARWLVDAASALPGASFEAVLAPGALAGRDLDEDPFFALVPISTVAGTILARVTVVPEPGSGGMCAVGLVALALLRRSRLKGGASRLG